VLPGEDLDKTRQKNAQALSSQSLNSLAEYWYENIIFIVNLLIIFNIGL